MYIYIYNIWFLRNKCETTCDNNSVQEESPVSTTAANMQSHKYSIINIYMLANCALHGRLETDKLHDFYNSLQFPLPSYLFLQYLN